MKKRREIEILSNELLVSGLAVTDDLYAALQRGLKKIRQEKYWENCERKAKRQADEQ
jgi:hypothetical protein